MVVGWGDETGVHAGVVPASLARYLQLWQEIARAPLDADVLPLYRAFSLHEVLPPLGTCKRISSDGSI